MKLNRTIVTQTRNALHSLWRSPPPAADIAIPRTIDINQLLHDGRSAFLRQMPKVGGTLLSAGCSGTWYFNWISERTGHSSRHIGLEFYSPKPHDLPQNVEWIANTVGDMSGVNDQECDLVFSGQNLEHLWPEDVAGFFLESNRVLKEGGWVVVDSPNRLVTEALGWSHPEHTVEYTPAEAVHITELAGFDVATIKGIWLCRDPKTNNLLPFDPNVSVAEWSTIERCVNAINNPDQSFIWWIEAKKAKRMPDAIEVRRYAQEIYEQHWPERTRRFSSQIGTRVDVDGRPFVVARENESGALIYGPYMPLVAGSYEAEFEVRVDKASGSAPVVRCDVLGHQGREIVARYLTAADIAAGNGIINLPFSLDEMEFGIQARCLALGQAKVRCHAQPIIASK